MQTTKPKSEEKLILSIKDKVVNSSVDIYSSYYSFVIISFPKHFNSPSYFTILINNIWY